MRKIHVYKWKWLADIIAWYMRAKGKRVEVKSIHSWARKNRWYIGVEEYE